MLFQNNEPLKILAKDSADGQKMGRMIRGLWLYFNKPVSGYHIQLRRMRVWLYRFEILGAVVFAVGMLVLFARQALNYSLDELQDPSFWFDAKLSTNSAPVFFWLSMVSFSFILYRKIHSQKKIHVVEQKDYKETGPEPDITEQVDIDWSSITKVPRKKRKNIAKTFTDESFTVLEDAYLVAQKNNNTGISPIHIFYALLGNPKVRGVFIRLGIPVKGLRAKIAEALPKKKDAVEPKFSESAIQVIFYSYENAYQAHQEFVGVTEILLATVRQSEALQEVLYDLEVDGQKLANVVEWVRVRERMRSRYKKFSRAASHVSKHGMDRAMTAVATPFLNNYSKDLTLAAKYGYLTQCVAREKEIREIYRVIEGGRSSIVLVGEHGVGKKSIVEGIVQRMIVGDVPKRLFDKRMVQLSTTALLAGTTTSGAQQRLLQMMHEIRKAKNIILFINNIQDLVSVNEAGGSEGLDVSESLAEFMGGNILVFATSTLDGYNRHINNSSLGTKLSRIDIGEMDENQTIQVLQTKAGEVEYKQKVFFSYDSLSQSANLSAQYLHDQTLPESALGIMSEAASYTHNAKGDNAMVSADDVAGVVADKTGIPMTSISEDESNKLLRLEEEMHKKVVGQEEAVKLVANALRRARAQIRSTNRPIANFLFLGPTGVGKTELTKTIAQVYFGGEKRMIRIDMSEFQDKSGIYRLIGQPGQKGSGILTEAVRQQPFSLVLLDEMEKADPDILNLFLQVFDDGRLTDSIGRVIDFTNTIIIATSNAGTSFVQEQISAGVPLEDIRQTLIRGELKKYYRPEFLNRFDGIVLFKSLQRDEIKQIASIMLKRVEKDLESKGVSLRVEETALEALAEAGFDPEFGARPMRRAIQEKIEDKLAELVLGGSLKRRDTVVLGVGAEIWVENP
jgi:ATP-dependent Clp protease ATP-binding subunit ClpC